MEENSEQKSDAAAGKAKKAELFKRWTTLKGERQSNWDPEYRDIGDSILPRRGRFWRSEVNKGGPGRERKRAIVNSKPTVAARTLRALMTSGMANPARRWFQGTVADSALKEVQSVKEWCFETEGIIRDVVKKSNLYQCLDNNVGDVGSFGTSVLYVEDDLETDVRGYVFPIGSYVLANSARLTPDTCMREVTMTARQLVKQFGEERCSKRVREDFAKNRKDAAHDVIHVIEPNEDYEEGAIGPRGFKYSSCWFEEKTVNDVEGLILREGGYHECPIMMVRWNVTGEDVYGSECPGMEALPDARALQHTATKEERAFDKSVDPPMKGPPSLIGQRASLNPGDLTYVDSMAGGQSFEPAMEIQHGTLEKFAARVQRLEQAVETAYYADLALMFQRLSMGKMTATEITARQQEQMLLLGTVSDRSEEELLRPLLFRVFAILWRAGKIPPPPQELVGKEMKFDFVSIISQAQKLLGTANIERIAAMVGNLVAVLPEAIDKLNVDQLVDEYAEALAVPPGIVRSDDEVAQIRAKRAQQQAQQAEIQQQAAAAEGAKTLAAADTSGDNALTRLLGNLTGRPAPGTPPQ